MFVHSTRIIVRVVLANVNRELPLRWREEQLRVMKQADGAHGIGATATAAAAAAAPRRDPPTAAAGARAAPNAAAGAHHAAAAAAAANQRRPAADAKAKAHQAPATSNPRRAHK